MYHHSRSISQYLVLGLTLFAPLVMKAGAISVNSNCYVGICSSVDSLSNGQSSSGSFDVPITFVNGDAYDISGTYAASYSTMGGSTINIDPVVSYLGLVPTIGTDTIDLVYLQDYFDPSCCTWAGTYTESVPLNAHGTFGPGSQMSAQLFYDGVGVGLVGPFTAPGSYFVSKSSNLDFGSRNTESTLEAEYDFHFVFAPGTAPGSGQSATPEPAPLVLCGLGLLLLLLGVARRNRLNISEE